MKTRITLALLISLHMHCMSAADEWPLADRLIGYTELRTNLPGGRHANVRTMRAVTVKGDGSGRQLVADELVNDPDAWTQLTGWSPDGKQAIVYRGWQDPENAKWEEQHQRFRQHPGKWQLDTYLVELTTGKVVNVSGVERVSHFNFGLFFMPDGRHLGFTAYINGVSKPWVADWMAATNATFRATAPGSPTGTVRHPMAN